MPRILLRAAIAVVVWPALTVSTAQAQTLSGAPSVPQFLQQAAYYPDVDDASLTGGGPIQQVVGHHHVINPPLIPAPPGRVMLDSPLYPSPKPGIPLEVGATVITNEALHPHEFLYPHCYRGLYGPFYHRTKRTWIMTPFGIAKNEKRVLCGTEVKVNYKSHISPFTLFWPRQPTWNYWRD